MEVAGESQRLKIAFDDEGNSVSTNSYAQTKGVEEKAIKNETNEIEKQ
jgi:hypothetical protein